MYKTLSAPLTAQIEITDSCNNNCLHCYNFWRYKDEIGKVKQQHMSPEQVELVLSKFFRAGILDVTITGGEPLLNKKGLITCLREARRLGIDSSVNSNLVLLNQDYLTELKEAGLKVLLTSVLGPNSEIHDEITQRKGSFEKLIKGINLIANEDIRTVVNMVVSQKNINFIKQTAKSMSSLGIKTFAATRASCPGNCDDFSELGLSLNQFREYLEALYLVGEELGVKVNVLESYPLCGIKDIERYKRFTGKKCVAGVTTFTVASNGETRPCSHINISYGNIFKEEISVIWERMKGWRNGEFMSPTCRQCSLFAVCGGGCRMEARTINGAFSKMDPHSSLDDVAFCLEILQNESRKNAETNKNIELDSFAVKNIVTREELFGSIAIASKKYRALLDYRGTEILKQIKFSETYEVNDKRIDWQGLDSYDFVCGLIKRNIVSAKYKGKEV